MNSNLKVLLLALSAVFIMASCSKDDDNEPAKIIVTMGAQSNTTIGGFYSTGQNKVFTQEVAFANQDTIDFLCFYEHDVVNNRINDISLASPGSTITGIFTGTTSPESWTVKNLTKFQLPNPAITVAEFDQLDQNDAIIDSYFDNTVTSGNKKAKLLEKDNIYAFKNHNGVYGLLRVIEVVQGAEGSIKFELKMKK
ncbi:hypothetical protein [Williamwhitmania taraxaci]|uniref:HmuY protein n=1 Tax=Williamwhitmania taraxaci TaxID=1640674 RepID=A0A1G6HH51_9BACT|nr:hypothetical protein [Williamwhitmania taraxaci]SDB92766.1 hypothetical protein SAMN05216323_101014 [Williamwhitmania taraxaci]